VKLVRVSAKIPRQSGFYSQRFEEHNGKPLRIIERVGTVLDVSPVTYPAYPGTEFKAK
jgi:phage head maturation protease